MSYINKLTTSLEKDAKAFQVHVPSVLSVMHKLKEVHAQNDDIKFCVTTMIESVNESSLQFKGIDTISTAHSQEAATPGNSASGGSIASSSNVTPTPAIINSVKPSSTITYSSLESLKKDYKALKKWPNTLKKVIKSSFRKSIMLNDFLSLRVTKR